MHYLEPDKKKTHWSSKTRLLHVEIDIEDFEKRFLLRHVYVIELMIDKTNLNLIAHVDYNSMAGWLDCDPIIVLSNLKSSDSIVGQE